MDLSIPKFNSLKEFFNWWQTPQVQDVIRKNPQAISTLAQHPNVEPWLSRFLNMVQKTETSPPASIEESIRILTVASPENEALRQKALHSYAKRPEAFEAAITADLASAGDIESVATELSSFAVPEPKGSIIAGNYRVIRRLGEGGMGAVYLAHDTTLDIEIALKMLKMDEFASEEEVERFLSEARSAAQLNHPNIVRVYNAGVDERGRFYIAMQFIEGGSLKNYLADKGEEHGARSMDRELARIFHTVAQALAHAHSNGIIHRDIKPANILLDRDGTPYLADFGLAKRLDAAETGVRTATYAVMGTPWYMSPELASGEARTVSPESDIFSFGATMYHAFTGGAPFEAPSAYKVMEKVIEEMPPLPRTLRPDMPRDIDAIIMKCLHKDRRLRYAGAGELAADLEAFLEGRPVSARPVSSLERFRWRLKRKKALVMAVLVAVLAAVLIGFIVWRQSSVRKTELKEKRVKAVRLFGDAKAAFENKEFEKALELVSKSLTLIPDSKEAQDLKSLCDARLQERRQREAARQEAETILKKLAMAATLDEQLNLLDQAIAADPAWLRPYLDKGETLKDANRDEEAIAAFERAIAVAQQNTDTGGEAVAHFQMGVIYWQKQDDKAGPHFNRVLQLMPDVRNPMTLFAQAAGAYGRKDHDYCIQLLDEALVLNPDFAEAYNGRGVARAKKGDYGHAIADFDKAIQLKPNFAMAFNNRGNVRKEKRDYDGAIADCTEAIRLNPSNATAFSNRGSAKIAKRDYDGAIADFNEAIRLNPSNAKAFNNRGNARKKKGDIDGAIADHTEAIRLNPNEGILFFNRANARKKKGDYDGAIADFDKAIQLKPNFAVAFNNRGKAKDEKRDPDGAIADYKKALEIAPNLWMAWGNLSHLYALRRDKPNCLEALRNLLRLNPRLRKWAQTEKAFDWLRNDPDFQRLTRE